MKYNRVLNQFLFPIIFGFLVFSVTGNSQPAHAGPFQAGSISFNKRVKSFKNLKFKNIIRQTRDYSCGAASLATVLTYYIGRETSEEEVLSAILSNGNDLKVAKIKEKGLSLLDLKNYGESLGYRVKGYKLPDYHNITKLKVPAIVLIDHRGLSHFVVVKGSIGRDVFIADPARGNIKINLDKFGEIWSNILLICRNPNVEEIRSHALSLNQIKKNRTKLSSQIHTDMIQYVISSPLDFN
jgi:predicted double-glycine peptidase